MSSANGARNARPRGRRLGVAWAVLLTVSLTGCSGSTGPAGPPAATGANGAGAPAPTGAPTTIAAATKITGTVTGVTIAGPPVVKFRLVGQNGQPLTGLPAADFGITIAKLVPGQNGGSGQWVSYIYSTVTPGACPAGVAACDSTPKIQATVESGTAGTLHDNGDGTYQYTFAKDITTDPLVAYVATLTHRVGFEIRGLAQANNGAYTFQPSSGATTGIFSREIVDTATCDSCHTSLTAHGGGRVEFQYCVMCHNPGTTDPASGNALDMKVMIHKIHSGNTLPSIQTANGPNTTPVLGAGYWIVGYRDSLSNFNTVLYPQDTRNCTTCHAQNHANLTEATNFKTVPTVEACGACHDNVNFATGANHASGIVANDTECVTCHGPASTIDNGQLQVVAAHTIPEVVAATHFQFIVNGITFMQGNAGEVYPIVEFSVVDPTNGNAPYNILTAAPFAGLDPGTGQPVCANGGKARLAIDVAWDNADYTNWGSGITPSSWGQPLSLNPLAVAGCASAVPPGSLTGPDPSGVFTLTSTVPLPPAPAANCPPSGTTPCAPVTNLSIVMEGHPGVVTTGPGATAIAVTSAVAYANTLGAAPVSRRVVVDIVKCDTCHSVLALHGDNRNNNTQVCVACHNPASTDVGSRQTLVAAGIDGLWEQTIDFKYMIHAIHAGSTRATAGVPFVVYGYGGSVNDFSSVVYPGQLNDCETCHLSGTYYPVNDSAVQATTLFTGLSKQTPNPTSVGNPISTSANTAICSACHVDPIANSHMLQNGGLKSVLKDAEGRTIASSVPTQVETCAVCHGAGGVADVTVVHNVPASSN